jgi:epoxide hydrolase 4
MHLIHHNKDQQQLSHYSLKYIKHIPGDAYNVGYVVRTNPGPGVSGKGQAVPVGVTRGRDVLLFPQELPGPPYGQDVDTSNMHYKMPCVVVWEMQEPCFSEKMLDGFYKWFDRSVRVVTMPNAGHWLWPEDPVKVNREVRSWVNALEAGGL